MDKWIYTRGPSGEYGWLNVYTNLFRSTRPLEGSILQNITLLLKSKSQVKLRHVKPKIIVKRYESDKDYERRRAYETGNGDYYHPEFRLDD